MTISKRSLALWLFPVLAGSLAYAASFRQAASLEGKVAKAFTLKTPDGASFSFDPKGQELAVVDFWATWCVPCVRSLPELKKIAEEYKGKGVIVVGVSVDQEKAKVQNFLKRNPLTFPVVMSTEDVVKDYGPINSIPRTFLVGKDGNVLLDIEGFDAGGSLKKKIDDLLAKGAAPKTP